MDQEERARGEDNNQASTSPPITSYRLNGLSQLLHAGKKVKNKDSTARDHLANERTFLAWLRTSAVAMALGLAIAHFKITYYSLVVGVVFVIVREALPPSLQV